MLRNYLGFKKSAYLLLLLGLILVGLFPQKVAAELLIWPVRPVIASGEHATIINIENRSKEEKRLQIRVVDWFQDTQGENFALQSNVISSPPFLNLAPNTRQTIRLYNRKVIADGRQGSWRVIIDELPVNEQTPQESAVKFRMRYSLPLIAYGRGAIRPEQLKPEQLIELVQGAIKWQLADQGEELRLVIENSSHFHWRISDVRLRGADGEVLVAGGAQGYLLPNSKRSWSIAEQSFSAQRLKLKVFEQAIESASDEK